MIDDDGQMENFEAACKNARESHRILIREELAERMIRVEANARVDTANFHPPPHSRAQ